MSPFISPLKILKELGKEEITTEELATKLGVKKEELLPSLIRLSESGKIIGRKEDNIWFWKKVEKKKRKSKFEKIIEKSRR